MHKCAELKKYTSASTTSAPDQASPDVDSDIHYGDGSSISARSNDVDYSVSPATLDHLRSADVIDLDSISFLSLYDPLALKHAKISIHATDLKTLLTS